MIKRTLYFGNPAYLCVRMSQLEIRLPEVEKNDTLPADFKASAVKRVPQYRPSSCPEVPWQ